jgi:hypothetical protein
MSRRWWQVAVMLAASACMRSSAPDGRAKQDDHDDTDADNTSTGGDADPQPIAVDEDDPPAMHQLGILTVSEEQPLNVPIRVYSAATPVRVSILGLPPGATWDATTRVMHFRPDFTQGGRTYWLTVIADNANGSTQTEFAIEIENDIEPPAPLVATRSEGGFVIHDLTQRTDEFLAGPTLAGEEHDAVVVVPAAALSAPERTYPVRVLLHGFMAELVTYPWDGEIRIHPYDKHMTSFWGHSDTIFERPADWERAGPYTQRRILHLLEWTLREVPSADPERVYVVGASMGGTGATSLALLAQRHFAWADARAGGTVPRHVVREWRHAALEAVWGSSDSEPNAGPNISPWDLLDMTRVLRDQPGSRNQMLFVAHTSGDNTVSFAMAVLPSLVTCSGFYEALQSFHVGHTVVWNEGDHLEPDPVLGSNWWRRDVYNPVHNGPGLARRDLAFVAFSKSSCDADPGSGGGDGTTEWTDDGGYATVDGRSGWDGDRVGALNRFLEWDSATIVDELGRFSVSLRVLSGDGTPPPQPGYPTIGDLLDCALPVIADVTPRRTQAFQATPGEVLVWRIGASEGTAIANDDGSVTVPRLRLTTPWSELVIERQREPEIESSVSLGGAGCP